MQYAITTTGERISPTPEIHALCPGCKDTLIAKCGSINIWHFAHKNKDCDPWYEPESEWHRKWKEFWPVENREVVIGNHRADIRTKIGTVIELQNSSISAEEIQEREQFYGKMIWIVNAESFKDNIILYEKDGYFSFRWKHPRKCWYKSTKSIYLDFGEILFRIKKLYPGRGWGKLVERKVIYDPSL